MPDETPQNHLGPVGFPQGAAVSPPPPPVSSRDDDSLEAPACYSELRMKQAPLDVQAMEGFKKVEEACYSYYVPEEWSVETDKEVHELVFKQRRQVIGRSLILDWYVSDTSDNPASYGQNHAEVKAMKVLEPPKIENLFIRPYLIKLTLTKPAAMQDPDWSKDELHLLLSVAELEQSFAFIFETEMDETVIQQIVSSFRFKD